MNNPTITFTTGHQTREQNTKNGPRTIHFQMASLETEKMRVEEEIEISGPNAAYPVGTVKEWDVVSDLVPGRFSVELKRRKTLVAVEAPAKLKSA